jgi:hypothetical protein
MSEKCEHCGAALAYSPQGEYCPNKACPPYAAAIAKQKQFERIFTQADLDAAVALRTREIVALVVSQFKACEMDNGRIPLAHLRKAILALLTTSGTAALAKRDEEMRAMFASNLAAAEQERYDLGLYHGRQEVAGQAPPAVSGQCVGYPTCDGSLLNEPHDSSCPGAWMTKP